MLLEAETSCWYPGRGRASHSDIWASANRFFRRSHGKLPVPYMDLTEGLAKIKVLFMYASLGLRDTDQG